METTSQELREVLHEHELLVRAVARREDSIDTAT
jgi:hypothetical protein